MPYDVRKVDNKWCVFKKGTTKKIGCHDTKEEARAQQAALYVKEGSEHVGTLSVLVPLKEFTEVAEETELTNTYWVQALKAGDFSHWLYGDVPMNEERFGRFKSNFDSQVLGQEIPIDFEHGMDASKGFQAAGWVRDMQYSSDRMDWLIEFTEDALNEIRAGKWKYFSAEFRDFFEDNDGTTFEDVATGGAVTNKPFLKGMQALNFSELFNEKEFAVWTTAYVNTLPDSSFLYVEAGGKKDSEGKTTPRSKRHLPVKDKNGKVDLPHLRNAIARIPQMKGISSELKSRLQAKARSMLSKAGGKKQSEEGEVNEEEIRELLGLSEEDDLEAAVKALSENVTTLSERDSQLREIMGIDENGDLVKSVKEVKEELDPIREAQRTATKEKQFSEQFPEEHAEMLRLRAKREDDDAKAFASRYERFAKKDGDKEVKSNVGLPMVTINKIEEVHKAFSARKATPALLAELLDLVAEKGFVDFSERGSSGGTELSDDPIKQFNSRIVEIMQNDNKSAREATRIAVAQHPDEYAAYREAMSQVTKTTA